MIRTPFIIGAGLAGLIAGVMTRRKIFEISSQLPVHRALLRFRSDEVSKAVGIPFKKVRVTKSIYSEGQHVPLNPALANSYSRKVLGGAVEPRSILNLDPVDRWIAPDDFPGMLAEMCDIDFGVNGFSVREDNLKSPFISTAPLPRTLESLLGTPPVEFNYRPVAVERYEIADCEAYCTVYFPDEYDPYYRASITGNILIVEYAEDPPDKVPGDALLHAFGLGPYRQIIPLTSTTTSYGKIAKVDDSIRRKLIHQLTTECNVYSLGRFATWRNVLLDDVVKDVRKIQDMINSDTYGRKLRA